MTRAPDGALLELTDIFSDLVAKSNLGCRASRWCPSAALHSLLEDRRHGPDSAPVQAQLVQQSPVEHTRVAGCFISVVLEDVPTTEFNILQFKPTNEFLDHGNSFFGTFPQADGAHLVSEPIGLPSFCGQQDPGDKFVATAPIRDEDASFPSAA